MKQQFKFNLNLSQAPQPSLRQIRQGFYLSRRTGFGKFKQPGALKRLLEGACRDAKLRQLLSNSRLLREAQSSADLAQGARHPTRQDPPPKKSSSWCQNENEPGAGTETIRKALINVNIFK